MIADEVRPKHSQVDQLPLDGGRRRAAGATRRRWRDHPPAAGAASRGVHLQRTFQHQIHDADAKVGPTHKIGFSNQWSCICVTPRVTISNIDVN